ncbi:hypothetical protein DQ04_01621060 [Trypanosoma grayi]|uniref:hypothetical protein n=1 Tax=Trypanosoma grayi TaxID=71804 RepID=UPI0004F464B9|nr:hypothetical protein DQ04_01621060 [Trypanosoma grayi]KEG12553.1 hypothetical protein DQ04_01621060 [Trypanosoma grayi]
MALPKTFKMGPRGEGGYAITSGKLQGGCGPPSRASWGVGVGEPTNATRGVAEDIPTLRNDGAPNKKRRAGPSSRSSCQTRSRHWNACSVGKTCQPSGILTLRRALLGVLGRSGKQVCWVGAAHVGDIKKCASLPWVVAKRRGRRGTAYFSEAHDSATRPSHKRSPPRGRKMFDIATGGRRHVAPGLFQGSGQFNGPGPFQWDMGNHAPARNIEERETGPPLFTSAKES